MKICDDFVKVLPIGGREGVIQWLLGEGFKSFGLLLLVTWREVLDERVT